MGEMFSKFCVDQVSKRYTELKSLPGRKICLRFPEEPGKFWEGTVLFRGMGFLP